MNEESHGEHDDAPTTRSRPKRGAFPTPKHEIEKATPFVPRAEDEIDDEADDTTPANGDRDTADPRPGGTTSE